MTLDAAAELGPFFALDTHPADAAPDEPWRPLAELVTSPRVLDERVATVRHLLAAGGGQPDSAVEERVAASVAHLGIAARLLSPALAAAVLGGPVPDFTLERTWWQPVVGGPVPLSVADSTAEDLASVLEGPIATLGAQFLRFSVSAQVIQGNVASALHGAAGMLTAARPGDTARTQALTATLMARDSLHGSGSTVAGRFRRRSCCLIYRAAPGGAGPICGDCVLTGVRA